MVYILGLILVVCSGLYIGLNPVLHVVVYIFGLILVVCGGLYTGFILDCM